MAAPPLPPPLPPPLQPQVTRPRRATFRATFRATTRDATRDATQGPAGPLSYHQQRLLRCRRALQAWLRRWGAYGTMAGVLLAAGSNSPLAVLAAALGALAAPMLHAVQSLGGAGASSASHASSAWSGWPALATCLLAYTAAGCLPAALTRSLWWPAAWAQAEQALPLSLAELRASDRRLLPWVLLPLPLLAASGALALGLAQATLWQHGLATTLGLLVLCALGSAWVVDATVARLRARQRRSPAGLPSRRTGPTGRAFLAWPMGTIWRNGAARAARPGHASTSPPNALATAPGPRLRPQPAWRVLLWWPLLRGKAQRTLHGLVLGGLATPALAAGPLATAPTDAGWWLAGLSAVALTSTAWLRSRSRDELAPLWQALRPLPMQVARMDRLRRGVCLIPAATGLLLASPLLLHLGARPAVVLAWATTLGLACWREAHPPPPGADQHAVRWLFSLVLAWVLGTEVMP